jgi:hypothetical protein
MISTVVDIIRRAKYFSGSVENVEWAVFETAKGPTEVRPRTDGTRPVQALKPVEGGKTMLVNVFPPARGYFAAWRRERRTGYLMRR